MDKGARRRQQGIHIESDVWVGARVTFLDGAEIGPHSVVAAGAIVRGKFPTGAIVGGAPARILKMRDGFAKTNSGNSF
ncbi:MAG: hypothetical protein KJ804_10935 [Proteobacteria bacterium]|nr:hypothetical protein [Pseudomonadota bacterium]MBU1058819.1 hypothetical protein [Pseudomonadota bacterium]